MTTNIYLCFIFSVAIAGLLIWLAAASVDVSRWLKTFKHQTTYGKTMLSILVLTIPATAMYTLYTYLVALA